MKYPLRIALPLAVLLLGACEATRPSKTATEEPEPVRQRESGAYDVESEGTFPPLDEPAPQADVPVEAPPEVEVGLAPVEEVDLMEPPRAEDDSVSTASGAMAAGNAEGGEYRLGFRVQVLASGELERARAMQAELERAFDEACHIEYEDSLYKVRLGDFISRDEALSCISRLKENGYHECWIVSTTVNTSEHTRSDIED